MKHPPPVYVRASTCTVRRLNTLRQIPKAQRKAARKALKAARRAQQPPC